MEKLNVSDKDKYFAQKTGKQKANILLSRADSFFNTLRANSYLEKLERMYHAYYGNYSRNGGYDSHRVTFTGEQGELVEFPVNHFGNIARHVINMITANRPIMEARAVNTDYKSYAQTILANGILDYYMRERRLEDYLQKACEMAVVLGAGYVKMEWNATAGETYDFDPDTGETIYEGELEFTNLSPFDVIVDGTKESWNNEWILTRSYQNKYNLMAKYPEFADKIKQLATKDEASLYRLKFFSNDETDDIPVYEFYHKRTEAMPQGNYMLFLGEDVVLLDTVLPYRIIPIFRMTAGDIMGTPYAYSSMFDVYPIQEMTNAMFGAIATNNNAFAVQNIFVPRNADVSVTSLSGGLNLIEGNAEPKPLNLTQTPAETFKFLEILIQSAETISGVNSVSRGNPEASLESGAALALVQSMTLQFMSGLQRSYVKMIEDVGTALIQMLKDFANTPRVVALVGKNNRPYLKEFTGDRISAINRVVVDIGNPLSRSTAGRVQMAQELLQMKLLKSPEQYFQVLNTGRLDSVFEGELNELMNIKSENESMMEAIEVVVSPIDQHRLHIQEHKALIADPDLRKDPNLSSLVLAHIQEHVNMLRSVDPDLLMLIGEQPLQPMGAPQEAPQMQGPIGGPQVPVNSVKGSKMDDVMMQQSSLPEAGQQIQSEQLINENIPNLPKVPAGLLVNPGLQEESLNNLK